jgi:phosphoribosylamine--glycine ligase
LEDAKGVCGAHLFHAGTKLDGTTYYTSGGRIVIVSGAGTGMTGVRESIYDTISLLSIEGAHYRRDIGLGAGAKRPTASATKA